MRLDILCGNVGISACSTRRAFSADRTAKVDTLLVQLLVQLTSVERYHRVFLVRGGGGGFAQEYPSPNAMARHFELNVMSVTWLNMRFLDVFGEVSNAVKSDVSQEVADALVIMNVSS